MTARHPDVPERHRGTFAGLAHPAVIEHLVRLGITAIELLPIHAFVDDRHLVDGQLHNYWGYNTLSFFAPAERYMPPGGDISQLKLMVHRLHEAGIEVLLDVVYNHTAEGNHLGPTLSFRGIDNASYYMLADDPRFYFDTTGCGSTVNLEHPRVLQMVMDSLRYWVEEIHVDGFRFDLATALAREQRAFRPTANFLAAIRQDPALSQVKLIAEPWDLGEGGYQVGNFPPGWAEWNGRYRDDLRSYWKGDTGVLPELSSGLLGTANLFDNQGRRPWASVNFVTAHDGFTLADLYAYDQKHNEANGEDNLDGHDDNRGWNCGAEGPTDDPQIRDLRARLRRGAMTTLILSQGTPMLLMGDEIGRTQSGNNNAYCQDNELSWMNWADMSERDDAFFEFVAGVVRVRRDRPLLNQRRFLHGERAMRDGTRNVTWLRPDGKQMAKARLGQRLCAHTRAYAGAERAIAASDPSQFAPRRHQIHDAGDPGTRWLASHRRFGARLDRAGRTDARARRRADAAGSGRSAPRRAAQMTAGFHFERSWGAELKEDGAARFRIWAPGQRSPSLVDVENGTVEAMQPTGDGWFELESRAIAKGAPYCFSLDDGLRVPDPAARAQASDVHGPSLLTDPLAYRWETSEWKGRPWSRGGDLRVAYRHVQR